MGKLKTEREVDRQTDRQRFRGRMAGSQVSAIQGLNVKLNLTHLLFFGISYKIHHCLEDTFVHSSHIDQKLLFDAVTINKTIPLVKTNMSEPF